MIILATSLHFTQQPGLLGPLFRTLCLPRKGFDPSQGLPKIRAAWQPIHLDLNKLAQYHQQLGLTQTEHLPLLYPHVIAGNMHMQMLTHKTFPIGLLGAVHLKNRITQLRPIKPTENLNLQSEITQWRVDEKGLEFDFVTRLTIKAQPVWTEVSTYFKRGKFLQDASQTHANTSEINLNSLSDVPCISQWELPKNRGKVYARLSGNYNPIHTSKHLAKLFGLKRDIAHGFGVLAQALDQEGIRDFQAQGTNIQLDTVFKGPLFLEENVYLKADLHQQGNQQSFDIYCGQNDKPSICAKITQLDN